MSTRVTSSRLVGRAAELAELEAALADAAGGHPSLAFVAGESGVGKSRLVSELASRARASGARVMVGDCVELGEGELPYAPLVAALRPLAREEDPVLDALPESARAELATLAPELGASPPVRGEEERGAAQRRLFEALLTLLERLGQEAPVLLALEDIHWADRSTRAFIAFLVRSLCDERALVLATYRSDELHRRHPLRPLLAEVERDPRARRIALERLRREELAAQLEDILGAPPAEDLVVRLFARSEGNPLFAEELLAAGLDGQGALPPTLRDALMVRIERLPDPAQEVLRVVAVARRADEALIADAGGFEPRVLRDALREAVAGHILVVRRDGIYSFRHALLREVVHDDLLPGEHSELHLALARALERRAAQGDDGVWVKAGIAHHYRSAGDQPAALRAAVRAAEAAAAVHAHGEAAALLERALELWERVPQAEELAGAAHSELLVQAARSHRINGDDDSRTVELLGRALTELDEEAEPRRVAEVLGALADAQWSLGRAEDGRATLRRALALVPAGDGPDPVRARLLAHRVGFLMLQGRYGEVREAAPEALTAAGPGAGAARVSILNKLGVALFALGEEEEGEATMCEAIDLARSGGHQDDLASVFSNLADAQHRAGRSREGLATAIAGQAEVAAGQRSRRWLGLERAEIAFALGDWEQAESELPPRPGAFSRSALLSWDMNRAELALGRGDLAAARPLLDETAELVENSIEPHYLAGHGVLRAELERRSGDLAAARAAVEDAIDRIEFCSEDGERLAEVSSAGLTVEADAAQRARDLGDADAERDALARAELLLARVQAATEPRRAVAAALRATAEAEAERAAGRPAPAAWEAAAAAWEAVERPYPAAIARWREAEARVRSDDFGAAIAPARAALATARRLGAAWLADEVEGLAARARLRLIDEPAARPAEPPTDAFGLTPRERQVLALVARGATNREIGAELYMAEKTASVHVSRILAKLDVRSRTEAAALAHRQGLEEWPGAEVRA